MEPSDHLFRRESGRMVAALTRVFGVHNLALAEDVVQDAFCRALEVWKLRGVPENPSAWLMRTAKNRAVDILRREQTARTHEPELRGLLESEWTLVPTVAEIFDPQAIADDELRMMFSCCRPELPETAQVALVLHLLCGFSVGEIANAFLTNPAAMEKRLWRAKKTLAESKTLFEFDNDDDVAERLASVQRALYLLFNEGYHGANPESTVRGELCREAIRLAKLLCEHLRAGTPASYALAALMCLHAARLPARIGSDGHLHSLVDQDRLRWDEALIEEGLRLLDASATGSELSEYHVEAAIASVHVRAPSVQETDWRQIVALYDTLLALRSSPVVALNRAIAVGQADGPERGLEEIRAITGAERLAEYPFYFAALGELEFRLDRHEVAGEYFRAAASLARNPMERSFLEARARAAGGR
jgi:RNA polymerase sigma-70 factor (ECF subfamily)